MYKYSKLHLKQIHYQFIPNNSLCNSKHNRVNSTLSAGVGIKTAPAAQAPTKTGAPKTATPMAIGSGSRVSNRIQPMEGQVADQKLSANHNSDVTSAARFGANNSDSDYVESRKICPRAWTTVPNSQQSLNKFCRHTMT